jgi:predicted regulator of Ras-like GTPase activity (Roadblock/LC7/MglB family)
VTEAYATALQNIINEFKNISPEITNAFIFKKNGEFLASNETTTEEIKKLIAAFNDTTDLAQTIGGIETLTIQGADSQLNITSMNNLYLATVSSRAADQKIVKTLTHVLVPTVVRLVDQIAPELSENELPKTIKSEDTPIEEIVLPVEETEQNEPISESPPSFSSEPLLPEPPVNQFMIEKIGGLLVPADTVRVDNEVIAKWNDLYDDKQITQVHIETLEGKKTTCKFKPIKEKNCNAKGIIQIPEKILQALQTSKGKLVMVKPVIT